MSTSVISVNDISKKYRIGERENANDSLAGQITDLIKSPLRNFNRIRRLSSFKENDTSDSIFWALRDISFEVKQGEVLGIIGKNGAGKSTLLKILSRITKPSAGSITIEGKTSSLLEVGTGFHLELTGRENVYLNGTILGMKKKEIDKNFDEIVDFSGVEKFLDTPVKRYSSGMMVRLAFAVAAHLNPEILIIDEVLAVGDVEFQKKCLNKMSDITGQGRTILFVSHNMSAVNKLCPKSILLKDGKIEKSGSTGSVLDYYINKRASNFGHIDFRDTQADLDRSGARTHSEILTLTTTNIDGDRRDTFMMGEVFKAQVQVSITETMNNPEVGICIMTLEGTRLYHLISKWEKDFGQLAPGTYEFSVKVPNLSLYPGQYALTTWIRRFDNEPVDDYIESSLSFNIITTNELSDSVDFRNVLRSGGVFTESTWESSRS